ncbi:hypothetical protein DFH06DRAFT_1350096 [Mycena polygramma]|nr:hypothetical protein DFH06DRAFT_1350096 [Mycena polygramma]
MSTPDVPTTMGALLIGSFFASLLSGVVILQTLLYLRAYKADPLDSDSRPRRLGSRHSAHRVSSGQACGTTSLRTMERFLQDRLYSLEYLTDSLLTALVTFLCIDPDSFFAHRIMLLSSGTGSWGRLWFILPSSVLGSAIDIGDVPLQSFELFKLHARVSYLHALPVSPEPGHFPVDFTLGLSVSSAVDIVITGLLFYLFQSNRPGRRAHVLDKLKLYAFETGVSLHWHDRLDDMLGRHVSEPHLLGLHFVIGKLYANSLLVTLNTRQNIRRAGTSSSGERGAVLYLESHPQSVHPRKSSAPFGVPSTPARQSLIDEYNPGTSPKELQINVETTTSIQYDAYMMDPKKSP